MQTRTRRIAGITLLVLALLILLFAVLGYVVAPRVVDRHLPGWIEDRSGLQATIGETSLDPLRLRLEATDLRLAEPGQDPTATAHRVLVDLSWISLVTPGWTLANLHVDGLDLRLKRRPDGGLHRPGRRAPAPAADGQADPVEDDGPTVHVRRATVSNARLTYIDHSIEGAPAITIAPIDASFADIGTRSNEPGRYGLSLQLPDGAELTAEGQLSIEPFASTGEIRIAGLHSATAWPFLRDQTRLAQSDSRLDFNGTYHFAGGGETPVSLVLDPFTLQVAGLDLVLADGGPPLLSAQRLAVTDGRFDLRQRELIGDAVVEQGGLTIATDDTGSNWGRALGDRDEPDEPDPPFRLLVRTLRLDAMAFAYIARTNGRPLDVTIDEVHGSGTLELTTGQSPIALRIAGADLQLARIGATGIDRSVTETVASARLVDGFLDIAARTFGAAELAAHAADVSLVRFADGRFGSPVFTAPEPGEPPTGTEEAAARQDPQWRFGFTQVSLEDGRISYLDRTLDDGPSVVIEPVRATLEHVGELAPEPGRYTLNAGLPGEAVVDAAGSLTLDPLASEGELRLDGLDAATVWPFIQDRVNIAPVQGRFDLATRYRFDAGPDGPEVAAGPFDLQVADLRLAPPTDGLPHLTARRATLRGGQFDLGRRQLVLPEVTLAHGHLTVSIGPDGESNWGALLADTGRPDEPQDPWHLLVQRLEFERMSVAYLDTEDDPLTLKVDGASGSAAVELQTGQTPSRLRITDAGLQLAGISAAGAGQQEPDRIDSASLSGGFIDFDARTVGAGSVTASGAAVTLVRFAEGRLGSPLFGPPTTEPTDRAATAAAPTEASDPPRPGTILPPPRPADRPWRYGFDHVSVDDARITYVDRALAQPTSLLLEPVSAQVQNLGELTPQPGQYQVQAGLPQQGTARAAGTLQTDPLQSTGTFEVSDLAAGVAWPFLREQLRIDQPVGRIDASGAYRVAGSDDDRALLLESLALQADGLRVAEAGAPSPLLTAQRLVVRDGRIDTAARRIVLPQVSLSQGSLIIESDAADTLNWARLVGDDDRPADPPAADEQPPWQASVASLQLDRTVVRYLDHDETQASGIEATVTGTAAVEMNAGPERDGVVVSDVRLDLTQIAMTRPGAAEAEQIEAASIRNGFIDTRARAVGADTVSVRGGELALVRDAQGELRVAGFRAPGDADAADADEGPDWRVRLGTGRIDKLAVSFADLGFEPPITYRGLLSAEVSSVDRDAQAPLLFQATLDLGPGEGSVRANGTVAQDLSVARASVSIAGLDFSGLEPLVARYATLELRSGEFAVDSLLVYQSQQTPTLRAQGRFEISNVLVDEEESDERFLSWGNMVADDFTLDFGPGQLRIEQMRIDEPGARIHIAEDGSLNLPSVVRPIEAAANGEAVPAADGEGLGFQVRIDRVDLRNGTVDFSDESLLLPFSASMVELQGTVLGISNEPDNEAVLKAEARIEPFGMSRIVGRMLPFRPSEFTDIRVSIENVAMPILSPYTATFAGRTVRSGRLWLDLEYTIVDDDLAGENRILIRDLVLGERVDAPNALDLPIELAIGLLTDEQGQISIEIPVTGEVGDPQFDYGTLVREAVTSTIQRVVSAPFRFLAELAGGDGRDAPDGLDGVAFEPGRDRLLPQQQEQLSHIAVAMARRPTLTLQVRGVYEPQRDGVAIRELLARRAVIEATGAELPADEPPGPIAFDQPRMREAVEALLAERDGMDAIQRIRQEQGPRTAQDPDAMHMAMYERLIELQPLDDNELTMLAVRRAQRIAEYLTTSQGVDPQRIELGEIRTMPADAAEVVAPLGLTGADRPGS